MCCRNSSPGKITLTSLAEAEALDRNSNSKYMGIAKLAVNTFVRFKFMVFARPCVRAVAWPIHFWLFCGVILDCAILISRIEALTFKVMETF